MIQDEAVLFVIVTPVMLDDDLNQNNNIWCHSSMG